MIPESVIRAGYFGATFLCLKALTPLLDNMPAYIYVLGGLFLAWLLFKGE